MTARMSTLVSAALLAVAMPVSAQVPPDERGPSPFVDSSRLGPAPLEDPEALFEWGRRAKKISGCTLAESAWLRVIESAPDSEWAAPAAYSTAVCLEEALDYDGALSRYRQVVETWPDDPLVKDALFRQGLVLEALGEYRAAKRIYKKMLRNIELRMGPSDKAAVAIQRDIELLRQGKDRKAVKRLLQHIERYESLDRESQESRTYWVAKAHIELGQLLSRSAAEVPTYLTGAAYLRAKLPGQSEDKLLRRQLDERGRDLLAAQGRYQQAIDMEVPEWTLAAVYYLGKDHEDLYRALVSSPPPPGLTALEAETYSHEVMDRSYPILVKAYRLYYHGHELSRSLASDTVWARLLAERTRALDLEGITVDELELPPGTLVPE